MAWFKRDKKSIDQPTPPEERRVRTEGLWVKCDECGEILYRADLEKQLNVCPACSHHMALPARARLNATVDPGTFEELDSVTPSRPDQCFSFKESPFLPRGNLRQATLKYAGVAMVVIPAHEAKVRLLQVVGHDTYYTGAATQAC